MALLTINFESRYLMGNTEVSVILPNKPYNQSPKEFYGNGKKYPVLWLLHGTFGDHTDWIRKSNIEVYACERDVIVVMPSALNSNYSNWDTFAIGYSMWDYLTEELMPLVYNWLPASDKREDNFIAGLSMGGGGAIKYAAWHPDKFAGVAVLSAFARNISEIDPENVDPRTLNSIRNAGGFENFLNSYENVWDRLAQLASSDSQPKIYCACGTEDFLYEYYLKFKEYVKELNLDAFFEEGPGSHEWRFWDKYIERAMDYFGLEKN